MSYIPQEELKSREGLNLAPMIDFLFLMLMFFASLAVSRVTTKDTDINLVEIKPETRATFAGEDWMKIINISIDANGEYTWVTDIRDYRMRDTKEVTDELLNQHSKGLLPADKLKTQILLKIDKQATWEPILKLIFAIRDAGFEVHPVYLPFELIKS